MAKKKKGVQPNGGFVLDETDSLSTRYKKTSQPDKSTSKKKPKK